MAELNFTCVYSGHTGSSCSVCSKQEITNLKEALRVAREALLSAKGIISSSGIKESEIEENRKLYGYGGIHERINTALKQIAAILESREGK